MRTAMRDTRGSGALMTVLILPLLMFTLTGVLELGALRLAAWRASNAADLATLVAINDQDPAELARSGTLRPAADAADVARTYFALNLEGTASLLAAPVEAIAASAEVAVYTVSPVVDELTGARYERPTVRLLASVPVRTPGLAIMLLPSVTTINVRSASSAR